MFLDCKSIGHAGNIIANGSLEAVSADPGLNVPGQDRWFGAIGVEKVAKDLFGFDRHADYPVMAIQIGIQEVF
jgi:hypothetical protein